MKKKRVFVGKKQTGKKSDTPHTPPSKNFYSTLILHIKSAGGLPNWGFSKQRMHYHITKLKKACTVENMCPGAWKIKYVKNDILAELDKKYQKKTVKKVKSTHHSGTNSYIKEVVSKPVKKVKIEPDAINIRGHGFIFKVKIPRKISNWNNRRKFLKKKNIIFRKIREYGEKLDLLGHKVMLYDKSIMVYMSKYADFYGPSAKISLADGFEKTTKMMKKLENIMGINIKTQGGYIISLSKAHFGNVNNELAKDMNAKKIKIRCLDKHGREWLLIDDSLRLDELETVNPKSSQKHMDEIVTPFFNGAKELYDKTGEAFTPQMILNLMGTQTTQMTNIISVLNILVQREALRSGIDISDLDPGKKPDPNKIKNPPPEYFG